MKLIHHWGKNTELHIQEKKGKKYGFPNLEAHMKFLFENQSPVNITKHSINKLDFFFPDTRLCKNFFNYQAAKTPDKLNGDQPESIRVL